MLKPRVALVLACACGLALALVVLYRTPPEQNRFAPPCMFHRMTGLHCPGCGSTRAVYALLHLRLGEALRKNILFVTAIPFFALWSVRGTWRWLHGVAVHNPDMVIHPWIVWSIIIATFAFGILRNLPWAPFNWLAPQ